MKKENLNKLIVFILAAGRGTRMNSSLPKVLHLLKEKPLLEHVLLACNGLSPESIHVVISDNHKIKNFLHELDYKNLSQVIQTKALGTGHAVKVALESFGKTPLKAKDPNTHVLITYGDVPCIQKKTLKNFYNSHLTSHSDISLLAFKTDNPYGYGRLLLDNSNKVKAIREESDCTLEEKKIKLCNSGIYLVRLNSLIKHISNIDINPLKKEYYLTDLIKLFYNNELTTNYSIIENPLELSGVNTQEQLKGLNESLDF